MPNRLPTDLKCPNTNCDAILPTYSKTKASKVENIFDNVDYEWFEVYNRRDLWNDGYGQIKLEGAIRLRVCSKCKYELPYETIEMPREVLQELILKLLDRANRAESEAKELEGKIEFLKKQYDEEIQSYLNFQREIRSSLSKHLSLMIENELSDYVSLDELQKVTNHSSLLS